MQVFDVGAFRVNFPEFADTVTYPTQQISFWAGLASKLVRPCIWGSCWNEGASLFVAHEITLAAQNAKAASFGGTPGVSGGVANTKTVGSATIGYDTVSISEADGGYWNLTNYGKQLLRLAKLFGARAVQL